MVGPWRTNRKVARAIAAETSINLEIMASHAAVSRKSIPVDFFLTRIAFDALAEEVGNLPPKGFRSVILLYTRIDYLNRLVALYAEIFARYRAESNPEIKKQIEGELDSAIEAFYRLLGKTIETANLTNQRLYKIGESWRFRREPLKPILMEEIDKRVQQLLEERRRNIGR